jgi:hypothetical protein
VLRPISGKSCRAIASGACLPRLAVDRGAMPSVIAPRFPFEASWTGLKMRSITRPTPAATSCWQRGASAIRLVAYAQMAVVMLLGTGYLPVTRDPCLLGGYPMADGYPLGCLAPVRRPPVQMRAVEPLGSVNSPKPASSTGATTPKNPKGNPVQP